LDWTAYDTSLRYREGTAVVPTSAGWLVHLPDEQFLRIEAEEASRSVVDDLLGGLTNPAAATAAAPGAGTADLLDVLLAEGALAGPEPTAPGWVVIVGGGLTSELVDGLLSRSGVRVELAADLDGLDQAGPPTKATPDAVVAVARWLPDRRWRALDGWAAKVGVPWHRAHGEGRSWYVGPFTVPGESPSYEDLRLRRLAACPWPADLLELWAWLDGGGTAAGCEQPGPGEAVAAALLAADVLAHLRGEPVPGSHVQVGVDAVTGIVRRHPVLPVPRDLLVDQP
jgi:hypothetical protein